MGEVEPRIMEGFASGIQHLLSSDWLALAKVFQDVEFIPKPEDGDIIYESIVTANIYVSS